MLNQILPQRFDNIYRGHPVAIWLFIPVLLMKTTIALSTIFNGRGAAQSGDGLPLDTSGAGGAEVVVALFAAVIIGLALSLWRRGESASTSLS